MIVLAVISTTFAPPPVKTTSAGASIATEIVPDVYPVPPSSIVIASTLPPFPRVTDPVAVPALNTAFGALVYPEPLLVKAILLTTPVVLIALDTVAFWKGSVITDVG